MDAENTDELRLGHPPPKRSYGLLVVLSLLFILFLALYYVFGKSLRYEISGGFKGWLTVQWANPVCPPLRRQGFFFIVSFPETGQFCTSNSPKAASVYSSFVYVYPDGHTSTLSWNEHGKPGTQVWLVGRDEELKVDLIFVGDEHEDWNRFPKPKITRRFGTP